MSVCVCLRDLDEVVGFFFLMIRRPPRSTLDRSSAASDVYKRQHQEGVLFRVAPGDGGVARAVHELVVVQVVSRDPGEGRVCLLYTSPSPRDRTRSRMPSSA